jgi:hypothetical protein
MPHNVLAVKLWVKGEVGMSVANDLAGLNPRSRKASERKQSCHAPFFVLFLIFKIFQFTVFAICSKSLSL